MTEINGYEQSDRKQHIDVLNLEALEGQAQAVIPKGGFGYISGGAENDWTLTANREAFTHKQIYPRVLANVDHPDLSTTFLGTSVSSPIMQSPLAAQGLANSVGEKGTAEAFAAKNQFMGQSTYSSVTIQDTAKAGKGALQFFQLYLSKDWDFNKALLDEAKAAGVKGIILTADATVGGYRQADIVNKFQFPIPMANLIQFSQNSGEGKGISEIYASAAQKIGPDDVRRIIDYSGLPVIVKGIQDPADAELAIGAGAAAVYVSNHGGRQLNGGPASFDCLPAVAEAVDGRVPIIFDGGIRRGSDVFKAIASGDDLVATGRPFVYALALGGSWGVEDAIDEINHEFEIVMQLAGCKTIEDIKNTKLANFRY